MKRITRNGSRLFVAVLAVAAVAGASVLGAGATSSGTLKIGAALIGPKNDKSFNQAAYAGILLGIKQNPGKFKLASLLENEATDQQRTSAVETLAPIVDIVMGVSASFGPIFDVEAAKFPTKTFVDIAGYTQHYHKNVFAFANDWGAPAFVAGAIAAKMTKSGIVGYVGGAEIPPTTQAAAAFAAGARMVSKTVKVESNIVGDFNDVAKAKAATAAMISDGADVIFPFLDAGIAGSYAAGKESGKDPAMFKLTIPDCTSYDNIVGTEVVNNVAATSKILGGIAKGTLTPGAAIFLDLKDPQIQTLQLCPKYKKNAVVAGITSKVIKGVNSGKIKLPKSGVNARPSYPYREGFTGKLINAGKTG